MNYRILQVEEWDKLNEIILPELVPSPEAATAAVAEDADGVIQGVLIGQLAMHFEPLVIQDPHVDFRRLAGTLEKSLQAHKGLVYYVFVPDEKIKRMVEIVGFEPTGWQAYRKEVM